MNIVFDLPTRRNPQRLQDCLKSFAAHIHEKSNDSVTVSVFGTEYPIEFLIELGHEYPFAKVYPTVQESPVRMIRVRERQFQRTKADYHVLIDDDFIFEAGSWEAYQAVLHYMVGHPQCGAAFCGSKFHGYGPEDRPITPILGGVVWNSAGMIFRGTSQTILPPNESWIIGSFDDPVLLAAVYLRGEYLVKSVGHPVLHLARTHRLLSEGGLEEALASGVGGMAALPAAELAQFGQNAYRGVEWFKTWFGQANDPDKPWVWTLSADALRWYRFMAQRRFGQCSLDLDSTVAGPSVSTWKELVTHEDPYRWSRTVRVRECPSTEASWPLRQDH